MRKKMLAWAVHAYTALGLASGLFALRAIVHGGFRAAFLWLALSLIIDSTDGPLARFFQTSAILPGFNGRKLDDITDYFNYVVVPLLILVWADLLPAGGWCWIPIPLIASAYGFCQERAKTPDGYFTGFPSYWNIVVLYLYLFECGQRVCLLIVLLFSLLLFIPLKYIDPFKTAPLRRLTRPLTILWGLSVLYIIYLLPDPPVLLVRVSFLYVCYYLLSSFLINSSSRARA